ncbi:MAG: hypothetical protein ABIQ40_19985 [Bacteroidia bacterium]
MRLLYLFLFLLLIISCTTPPVESSTPGDNSFRESVLQLSHAGLMKNIPSGKIDSLITVYKKDSLNGIKELLVASGDLLKINVALNGRTLDEVYKKICDTIGMKFPELKSDEVQTSILPDLRTGEDTGWVVVKIRFGQTWYERKLYYFRDWQIDDFIYRIYNRKMADDGKNTRLHLVEYNCTNCQKKQDDFMGNTDVTRYGYLMLNKAQEDSLVNIPLLEMENENEFNIYTTAEMNEQLKKFEASGLNKVPGEQWYTKVKEDIMQSSIYQQEDIYDFFDTLFSYTDFDTSNPYNPYEDILFSLSDISRSKFIPSHITDDETAPGKRDVRFTYEEDVYEFEAEQRGAYMFPGIIDNVNKALADHKAGGAFYTILTKENICRLIYLKDEEVEKVKVSGFFPQLEKGPSKELKDRWSSSMVL